MAIDFNDKNSLENIGITSSDESGKLIISNDSIETHKVSSVEGIDILPTKLALTKYPFLKDLLWKNVNKRENDIEDLDKIVGYCVYVRKGVKTDIPIQSCLFIKLDRFYQKVHNIIFLEDDSEIFMMTGCATANYVSTATHEGITEIFIGRNSKLNFTMIHDWDKNVEVLPRTGIRIRENGSFISNYISLKDVKNIKAYPTAFLDGNGAKAYFNSLIYAKTNSNYDMGARIIFNAENTNGHILSRSVSEGGNVISRGHLYGKAKNIKGHLECDALMLKDEGKILAVPEIETDYSEVELTHEAAIGKISEDEIYYLMSRGFSEKEAKSIIIKGFLDVETFKLPEKLQKIVLKTLDLLDKNAI